MGECPGLRLRALLLLPPMRESSRRWVRILRVTVVPLLTWPILTLSIILILTSIALALFILLHKGRGGGMSDLFGGGTTSNMGGTSVAERNLDRITIVVGLIWLTSIFGLLTLYRFFPEVGAF